MPAEESTLVPVAPDDTVDTILKKVRGTGARSIELLVAEGTAALQAPRGFERLRRALDPDGISLLVISSDAQALEAARRNRIDTVGVEGTRVLPGTPRPPDRPARDVAPPRPIDTHDAALLDAIDQLPERDYDADLPDEGDERYVERPGRGVSGARRYREDDFDAEQEDWPDLSGAETVAAETPLGRDRKAGAERRYAADDFELPGDEPEGPRRTGSRRTRPLAGRDTADLGAAPGRGRRGATTSRGYAEEGRDYPARRRLGMPVILSLAAVGLLVLAGAFWLLSSRATVTVAPPSAAVREFPFSNEVIPLAGSGAGSSTTALQAVPVAADVETSVTGQVSQETMAPTGTAKGIVTVINTIGSAVPIPKGSEFVGKNQAGQEVRFLVDGDTTIPGATTTSSLTGSSTTYGQINVNVTARSPGSASNVPQNSITQLLIPGQQPIQSQASNFIFQNDAIGGGSEAPQRVVSEDAVQAILKEALTQLYNDGLQQLRAQIDESKLGLDEQTIWPPPAELGKSENYQVVAVEPAIGQTVAPDNPGFNVTVRTHLDALATPRGSPVQDQLGPVVPEYFRQRGSLPCKADERPSQDVTKWRWDGQKFTIDGAIKCTPAGGLPAETIARVKDALRGQSRDAADAALQTLQKQGLIGRYQLPAGRASFPGFDWLIDVEVGSPAAEPQPSGLPQPSQGAS